ncbi:MAG TPA: phosphatase PAP2 family protein [Terriglobales bacterium]|jgi:membrane-associated phospholipid phosphatase|nr:phosphatase PAP2 family protein [Terriglobales bacterium]
MLRSSAFGLLLCAALALVLPLQIASAQNTLLPTAQDTSVPPAQNPQGCTDPSSADSCTPTPAPSQPAKPPVCGLTHLDRCAVDILHDQAGIWTSPLRLQSHDSVWLVPFAAATGVALVYDKQALQNLGSSRNQINISNKVSDLGSGYTLVGEGAGLFLIGSLTHNEHLTETGRLGIEAIIDASIVGEGLKLATNRQRPDTGNGSGAFWPNGMRNYSLNSSFPSGHAIATWAFARVVASEYPNKLVDLGVYAVATAVSVSRVTGRHHFPSDALVGSALGYLIGGYVVRHHSSKYKDPAYSFLPIVDQRTHTYGMTLRFLSH